MAGTKRMKRQRAASSLKARHDIRITWLKRVIAVAVIALAAGLLYNTLSGYSLDEIIGSIKAIPATRLALAGLFAAGSYFCLSWFDWLAVRYAGTPLPYRRCALASFCSLSLGHNIGFAALSSGAVRYRFYTRWGLSPGQVAKIIIFCGITVGVGLLALAGVSLMVRNDLAAKMLGLTPALALAVGAACLVLVALYPVVAIFVRGKIRIKRFTLEMPEPKLALAQIGIGAANFACVAACLYQTLAAAGNVSYLATAAAYVMANAGALITHVPGGIGVIESVVMFLMPGAAVVGALVMFRVIYFLIPLCLGGPLFGITELYYRGRKRA